MKRNILNIVMTLCLLAVMDYRFTANAIHEIFGVFIVLLFFIHNVLNRCWFTAIGKGKMNLLRILNIATNLLLVAMMLLVTVTGVLISQTVFSFFPLRGTLLVHELHTFSAYMGLILCGIHLGFHWNALWGKLCRWLSLDCTSFSYIILSRIASLIIIGYGIYASFTRHIGSKLLFQHVFWGWSAKSSLGGFLFDYMAIMGCYVAITYYLIQMLQKQNYKNIELEYTEKREIQ